MESLKQSKPTFGVLLNSVEDPDALDRQAEALNNQAQQLRDRQAQEREERAKLDRQNQLELLKDNQKDLAELEETLAYSEKLPVDELKKLVRTKKEILNSIKRLEDSLGVTQQIQEHKDDAADLDLVMKNAKPAVNSSKWPTIAKVLMLIFVCSAIVLVSGDFILDKYPNAAIYNDVSFQKVLFAFSVFIFIQAGVIISLWVFIPGIGKYFNPFNSYQLDFYQDFKELSTWQRTCIAVAIYSVLLYSFVSLASGKLD